jgi:myosin-crossreactive antigen
MLSHTSIRGIDRYQSFLKTFRFFYSSENGDEASSALPPEGAERKKIAIIGSGLTGLAALWTLRDTSHEIHLFVDNVPLGGTNPIGKESIKGKDTASSRPMVFDEAISRSCFQ